MAILEMPVRGDVPEYQFRLELQGTVYTFRFKWNTRMERWIMDIADEQDNDILNGIVVQANVDLKQRFRQTTLPPGLFLAFDETGAARNPDRDTFGNEVKLFYEESA